MDGIHVQVIRGFALYPSDQRKFPLGVGVAAMHKSWFGYWMGRIHTARDTVFMPENIELLRQGALSISPIYNQGVKESLC